MMKKVSQAQIARSAGVSQALVSLVLNGKRTGVAEETCRRIWECAEQLGYRRRGAEVRLDARAVQTVGYVLRSPLRLASTSNFFSEVLEGLDDFLVANLARTTFLGAEDDLERRPLREIVERDQGFRGIVAMGQLREETLDHLLALDVPIVCISFRYPGLCHSVNANEAQAAEHLVGHLLAQGHRRFAFLGSRVPVSRSEERRQAFWGSMRRRGGGAEVVNEIYRPTADRRSGWEMAETLLAENSPATAWVCVGGLVARGVCDVLQRSGGGEASRIAVVSMDFTQICFHESPPITAAGTLPQDLGREAGKLLFDLPLGDSVLRDLAMPATFAEGTTSGPLIDH